MTLMAVYTGLPGWTLRQHWLRCRFPDNASQVSLKVYDLLGREVVALVNEEKAPGSYNVTWDASGQSSGMYFCRLRAGSFVETRKMVVLK